MKASETLLRVLLEGQKQFQVPLFQRPYTWKKHDWQTLWNDLVETYVEGSGSHFLGSVVTKTLPGTPDGVSPFLVIDGQQRLTTISILLAALRDHARESAADLASKIHDLYLINRHASGHYAHKMRPTQVDRRCYATIVNGQHTTETNRIAEAYRYFRRMLQQPINHQDGDSANVDLNEFERVLVNNVELVSITLDTDDNEYRIFESLNAKGEPLTQADLIRNHFFMQIPPDQQEMVFNESWLPMQERLDAALADYFHVQLQAEGRFVRGGDTYLAWKQRLAGQDPEGLIRTLRLLNRESVYYLRLLQPETEPNVDIRTSLRRLNRWRGRTAYPFLLNVYRDLVAEKIDAKTFRMIVHIVESFQVRRYFAGVPTNQLNRLFLRLYHQLPNDMEWVEGVMAVLSAPSRRWPTDADMRERIPTFKFYVNGRANQKRLVLETIVESFGHKEPVDLSPLTIEHILPQSLTAEWREELGDGADDIYDRLVHTLGNLTLTGYNPELSNEPFRVKRDRLRESNLQINREIADEAEWRADQIEQRSQAVAERCIRIWRGPAREGELPKCEAS